MKAKHINPFLNATLNLFENMLGHRPEVGEKALVDNIYSHRWDVSGVIGITGASEGIIAVRLTKLLVKKLLLRSRVQFRDEEEFRKITTSMVGEMANVIAGNALNEISECRLDITVPIVVQGKNHSISWPEKHPIIAIPFRTPQGPFEVNVSIQDNELFNPGH